MRCAAFHSFFSWYCAMEGFWTRTRAIQPPFCRSRCSAWAVLHMWASTCALAPRISSGCGWPAVWSGTVQSSTPNSSPEGRCNRMAQP